MEPQETTGSSADSDSMTLAISTLRDRLIQTRAAPAGHLRAGSDALAPPLPPKPAIARGPSIPQPPPLPPKPFSARAPRVGDQHSRPLRPLPVLPIHDHETSAPPPLPSAAKPPRHRRYPSESTQDVTGTLPSSSSSSFPLQNAGFHPLVARREDQLPPVRSVAIPFPPPLGSLREAGFPQLLARLRTDNKDAYLSRQALGEGKGRGGRSLTPSGVGVSIPRTLGVDAEFGAAAIARQRKRVVFSAPHVTDVALSCPALCGGYPGSQPGGELWSVVDEVVNASKYSGRSWSMAMKVLVGMIITATVDSLDSGYGLCSEVVRRMRARSTALGAEVFTLLTNIGAQAVFAGTQWHRVEQMVLSVFSNVVGFESKRCPLETSTCAGLSSLRGCTADTCSNRVEGEACSDVSGCQAHRLFWERAVKCGMALLGSRARFDNVSTAVYSSSPRGNSVTTKETLSPIPGRRPEISGPAVSLHALIALCQHIPSSMHPSVERVLIGDCIWRGFRGSFDEDDDVLRSHVDEDRLYTAFGGIRIIVGMYVRCRSLVARRRMFVLITEVAVGRVSTRGLSLGRKDVLQSEDSVNEFFSVLRAYDAADALVGAFRLGPEPSFVMDILRHIIFDPLSFEMPVSTMLSAAGPVSKKIAGTALPERRGSRPFFLAPNTCDSSSGPPSGKNLSVTKDLMMATFVANEVLPKRFVLRVLMQLEDIARSFSRERSKYRESGGDVFVSEKVDIKIAELRQKCLSSHSLRSVRHVWHSISEVLYGHLGRTPLNDADIVIIFELMFSVILVPPPFTKVSNELCDSEGVAFLHGERSLRGRTSSKDCGDLIVGLLHTSAPFVGSRYVSELRQSFVEILGASTAHTHRLMQFADDPDAVVAFRARTFAADTDVTTLS